MSTTVMGACWPLQMPPTPKAVLISLADNANDHGECWPSIPTIALRTCFTERSVQRAIGWLEAEGLLVADRSNGRHTRYTVTPPTLLPLSKNPRQRVTPDRESPVTESRKPTTESRKPPSQSPSNRKEPSRTVKEKKRASAPPSITRPDGVDETTWADWLTLRKAKKAPVTATVLREAEREALKAGLPLTRFLEIWCARGSQGLQAEWLKPNERGSPPASAPGKTMQAIQALEGMKRGNRMDAGRVGDGAAKAALLGPGSPAGE